MKVDSDLEEVNDPVIVQRQLSAVQVVQKTVEIAQVQSISKFQVSLEVQWPRCYHLLPHWELRVTKC